jgi:hypothetical protein
MCWAAQAENIGALAEKHLHRTQTLAKDCIFCLSVVGFEF